MGWIETAQAALSLVQDWEQDPWNGEVPAARHGQSRGHPRASYAAMRGGAGSRRDPGGAAYRRQTARDSGAKAVVARS